LFLRFAIKMPCAFDENDETHLFIKEIFRAAKKAPPLSLHPPPSEGGGVVLALFSQLAVALVMVLKQCE
jgi:hypothetical protein